MCVYVHVGVRVCAHAHAYTCVFVCAQSNDKRKCEKQMLAIKLG